MKKSYSFLERVEGEMKKVDQWQFRKMPKIILNLICNTGFAVFHEATSLFEI